MLVEEIYKMRKLEWLEQQQKNILNENEQDKGDPEENESSRKWPNLGKCSFL